MMEHGFTFPFYSSIWTREMEKLLKIVKSVELLSFQWMFSLCHILIILSLKNLKFNEISEVSVLPINIAPFSSVKVTKTTRECVSIETICVHFRSPLRKKYSILLCMYVNVVSFQIVCDMIGLIIFFEEENCKKV